MRVRDEYIGSLRNRTLCDVLTEMRSCNKTANYSNLLGLIEEAQSMGNRMEAKLYDNQEVESARDVLKGIKKEVKALQKKRNKLKGDKK